MKNYTDNKENAKRFITKIKIKKNKIIVYLADKTTYVLPYTDESYQKITEYREKQVKFHKGSVQNKIERSMKRLQIPFLIIVSSVFFIRFPYLVWFILGCGGIATIATIATLLKDITIINDYGKFEFYLQNKQFFDEFNGRHNHLVKISKKTLEKVRNTSLKPASNLSININVVDNLTLDELKQIKANIERDSEFKSEFDIQKVKTIR